MANRKEARELRPKEAKTLKDWRTAILKAPTAADTKRLTQLAAGVEKLWSLATARIEATQRQLRRPIGIYGADIEGGGTGTSRDSAYGAIENPNTPLGRLRAVMDAWTGLWFWPLDVAVKPPSWDQWLQVVEELVRPDETHGLEGQLDIFTDYQAMLDADEESRKSQATMADLRERHQWLVSCARRGLSGGCMALGPRVRSCRSRRGGFDLQVGNPPWVRLDLAR